MAQILKTKSVLKLSEAVLAKTKNATHLTRTLCSACQSTNESETEKNVSSTRKQRLLVSSSSSSSTLPRRSLVTASRHLDSIRRRDGTYDHSLSTPSYRLSRRFFSDGSGDDPGFRPDTPVPPGKFSFTLKRFGKCRVGKAKKFLTRFNTKGTVKLRVKNARVKTECVKKKHVKTTC